MSVCVFLCVCVCEDCITSRGWRTCGFYVNQMQTDVNVKLACVHLEPETPEGCTLLIRSTWESCRISLWHDKVMMMMMQLFPMSRCHINKCRTQTVHTDEQCVSNSFSSKKSFRRLTNRVRDSPHRSGFFHTYFHVCYTSYQYFSSMTRQGLISQHSCQSWL